MHATSSELILVVDDSAANRYFFNDSLQEAGYRVGQAASSQETFDFLARELPDLILLDVHLPGPSGLEICAELKRSPRFQDIPVIQTSAIYTRPEDHSEGVDSGADGYIVSPVDPLVLVSEVRARLRLKKQHEKLREIAEREKARTALEKQWLSNLINVVPFPIVILSPAGESLFINSAARSFFEERLDGAELGVLRYGEQFWLDGLGEGRARLEAGELTRYVSPEGEAAGPKEALMSVNGDDYYVTLDIKAITSLENEEAFLLTFIDISTFYANSIMLSRSMEGLNREKHRYEQLVTGLLKELREPLDSALGQGESLLKRFAGDPGAASLVRMMQENVLRAGETIGRLLDAKLLSREQAGTVREDEEAGGS